MNLKKPRKTHIIIMSTNNRLLLSSKMKHTHTHTQIDNNKSKTNIKKTQKLSKILRNRSPGINNQLTAFVACWGSSGARIHAPNKL